MKLKFTNSSQPVFLAIFLGTATGLVVATGDHTFIGRIAGLATGLPPPDTPMSREINHFVKLLTAVAVVFGVAFFIVALFMGYSFINAALFLIGNFIYTCANNIKMLIFLRKFQV